MKVVRRGSTASRRAGVVLVFFALVLFGVFALMAVSIEIAAASYAQAELQDAVDVASREGLRLRDDAVSNPDLMRRQAASGAVTRAFTVGPNPVFELDLGAGGVVPLSDLNGIGGAGGFEGSDIGRFVPNMALNLDNLNFGDLVAGEFDGSVLAGESSTYVRPDFTPSDPALSLRSNAFLVRARRTPEGALLDNVPGASTSGPPLPFLFGLGAAIQPVPGQAYDPRRDGISVRATAIAEARPALSAGRGPAGFGLLDYGAFGDGTPAIWAFELNAWNALDPTALHQVESTGDDITDLGTGTSAGFVMAAAASLVVGQTATTPATAAIADTTDILTSLAKRPVAIVRVEGGLVLRIVGFASLLPVSLEAVEPGGGLRLGFRVGGPTVAAQLATSHAPDAWLALEPGGPLEVLELRTDLASLQSPLLAPVLAR